MKKQYTKKQIIETIRHWKMVLAQLNESQLLNVFENIYGKQLYSNSVLFNYVDDNTQKTFNALNDLFFNSKLKALDIQFLTTSQIQKIFDKYSNPNDPKDLYAVYFPIPNWQYIEKCNFTDIRLIDQYFIVNISNCQKACIAFMISIICHEMIHYYDTFYGDVLQQTLLNHRKHQSYDEHTSKTFQEKMNQINKSGLTIIPYGNDVPIDELNKLSAYRLKKQLTEDEYYDQLFNTLLKQHTNIFDKTSIEGGELGPIAF